MLDLELGLLTFLLSHLYHLVPFSVSDPDPDWIRIQLGLWIRIRNLDPDPGRRK